MMMRKSLFLILTLLLVAVPVFLMAHAFTHFAQTDVQAAAESGEEGVDLDEICLDCLALTGFNVLLLATVLLPGNSLTRHRLPFWPPVFLTDNSHLPYRSRAPPAYAI